MIAVTLFSSAIGTVAYTSPVDGSIVGCSATVACLLSRDPNQTFAQFNAPTSIGFDLNPIAVTRSTTAFLLPKIPVLSGEGIYAAFSAAGSITIYIDTAE